MFVFVTKGGTKMVNSTPINRVKREEGRRKITHIFSLLTTPGGGRCAYNSWPNQLQPSNIKSVSKSRPVGDVWWPQISSYPAGPEGSGRSSRLIFNSLWLSGLSQVWGINAKTRSEAFLNGIRTSSRYPVTQKDKPYRDKISRIGVGILRPT